MITLNFISAAVPPSFKFEFGSFYFFQDNNNSDNNNNQNQNQLCLTRVTHKSLRRTNPWPSDSRSNWNLEIDSEGRLNCEPGAAPKPTFEWSKVTGNNQGDIKTGGCYTVFPNGTLIIANLTQNDEGQYGCKASNFFDTASATADASIVGM